MVSLFFVRGPCRLYPIKKNIVDQFPSGSAQIGTSNRSSYRQGEVFVCQLSVELTEVIKSCSLYDQCFG